MFFVNAETRVRGPRANQPWGSLMGWLSVINRRFNAVRPKIKLLQAVSFCATSNIQRTAVTLLQRMRTLFVK
jgi:hypothetical protein